MFNWFACLVFLSIALAENEKYYETYTGKDITLEQFKKHIKDNTTFWCTGKYKPCDPDESNRPDGTCNNLQYPTRGPAHTPYISELPLVFDKNNEPVKMKSGKKLDPRTARLKTLINGEIADQKFSLLSVHYLLFGFGSIGSLHDTIQYVRWKTYCCLPKGKKDPECYPMPVHADDMVHQFSNIRCLNNTKPISYQSVGCIKDKSVKPARINSGRSFLDLHAVYGDDNFRTFNDGMIKVEEESGLIWPPSLSKPETVCLLNELPREKRCHATPPINSLIGLNFFSILFWRHHNLIAKELKEINPSWDDDKLYKTAKDINTAHFLQIYYYELMPLMIGKSNLLRAGVISRDGGFRDLYQEDLPPQQSLEYSSILRWAHTIQPGHLARYDSDGYFLNTIPVLNTTLRTGMLAVDNNLQGFTQGSFRQPAAKFDHVIDPALSETGLKGLQRAFDIPAADLMKCGLFGFQPYIAYRKLCTGRPYRTFEDLRVDMKHENIEMLENAFESVEDVPLMAGIWLEDKIPGGDVPRTFACLKIKQLKRFIAYDRFWFERPNHKNAFTREQLLQIRNATVARLLCDVGDTVTSIQPRAFLRISPWNQLTSCSNIRKVDLSAWKDEC